MTAANLDTATAALIAAAQEIVTRRRCGHLDCLVGANREAIERLAYAEAQYVLARIEAEFDAEEAAEAAAEDAKHPTRPNVIVAR